MIPWTTPTFTLTVKGVDLTAHEVYADFAQGTKTLHVAAASTTYDGTDTTVTVELTQTQTGKFAADKPVTVQVNWITADSKRDATEPKQIDNGRNLYERELEYGSDNA